MIASTVPPASRISPAMVRPIAAGRNQPTLMPRRASRSTPRVESAFITTTVQSPLSTFHVRSVLVSVVVCATQNVWSAGAAGTASPVVRR